MDAGRRHYGLLLDGARVRAHHVAGDRGRVGHGVPRHRHLVLAGCGADAVCRRRGRLAVSTCQEVGGYLALAEGAVVDRDLVQVPGKAAADGDPGLRGCDAGVGPGARAGAVYVQREYGARPGQDQVVPLAVGEAVGRIDRRVGLVVEVERDPVPAHELEVECRCPIAVVAPVHEGHVCRRRCLQPELDGARGVTNRQPDAGVVGDRAREG